VVCCWCALLFLFLFLLLLPSCFFLVGGRCGGVVLARSTVLLLALAITLMNRVGVLQNDHHTLVPRGAIIVRIHRRLGQIGVSRVVSVGSSLRGRIGRVHHNDGLDNDGGRAHTVGRAVGVTSVALLAAEFDLGAAHSLLDALAAQRLAVPQAVHIGQVGIRVSRHRRGEGRADRSCKARGTRNGSRERGRSSADAGKRCGRTMVVRVRTMVMQVRTVVVRVRTMVVGVVRVRSSCAAVGGMAVEGA